MINIIITDDHSLIIEGIKNLISRETDMSVQGYAQNAAALFLLLKQKPCDILLLDINLPDLSGLEILKKIREEYSLIKVLILSMYPEEMYALRALKMGAFGYLTKDSASNELVEAIRTISKNRKYTSEVVKDKLLENLGSTAKSNFDFEQLSEREFQIMRLIASGKSVSSISAELFLSVSTVNTYRQRLLSKLGLKTNAALIHYAIDNKLVE